MGARTASTHFRFLPTTIDKKNELLGTEASTIFSLPSFLPFSLSLSVPLYMSVDNFYCIENWPSSSYTRIQFISSSVRHTQLNGNMAVVVERRKELVHTHTFLCVERRDYAFWCLSGCPPFFLLLSFSFSVSVKERSTNFFFSG